MTQTLDILKSCLEEALHQGLPELDLRPSLEPSGEMQAELSFESPLLRGNICFMASEQILAQTCPIPLTEDRKATLQDWLGELGNLVLGRFKNALLARGVVLKIHMGRLALGGNSQKIKLGYLWQGHSIGLVCDLECNLELAPAISNSTDLMPGDAIYRLNEPAHLKKNYDVIAKIRSGVSNEEEAFIDDLDENASLAWQEDETARTEERADTERHRDLEGLAWDSAGILTLSFTGDLNYTLSPAALLDAGYNKLTIEGLILEFHHSASKIMLHIPKLQIRLSQDQSKAA